MSGKVGPTIAFIRAKAMASETFTNVYSVWPCLLNLKWKKIEGEVLQKPDRWRHCYGDCYGLWT